MAQNWIVTAAHSDAVLKLHNVHDSPLSIRIVVNVSKAKVINIETRS